MMGNSETATFSYCCQTYCMYFFSFLFFFCKLVLMHSFILLDSNFFSVQREFLIAFFFHYLSYSQGAKLFYLKINIFNYANSTCKYLTSNKKRKRIL